MPELVQGLVSTIIPAYNRPEMLRDAVESVQAQTYRPIGILISDDGSRGRRAGREEPESDLPPILSGPAECGTSHDVADGTFPIENRGGYATAEFWLGCSILAMSGGPIR